MSLKTLKLEEILSNGKYRKHESEFSDNKDVSVVWSTGDRKLQDERKVYTYDEAIDLTGSGWYNVSLLITLALAVQAMTLDMFGFSYVVTAAACDLRLSHTQTTFLMVVPFIGAIVSAYPLGYISDTRGRKTCLSIALWGSFFVSSVSALSPNYTVLASLKLLSSSLSSGIQSMAYTLMGESCSARTKSNYMLFITTALVTSYTFFTAIAFAVLGLDFTYDLGFIAFKPWRLLILTLAMTLGSSAVLVGFFHESPKFLVNAGRSLEALTILRKIKKRNGGDDNYPVNEITLSGPNSILGDEVSFPRSLWDQVVPLLTPPLLQRTLLLFYIIAVIYSVNNGVFLWSPVIVRSFFEKPIAVTTNFSDNFCDSVASSQLQGQTNDCTSMVNMETLLLSVAHGLTFGILNFCATLVSHKKKSTIISILVYSSGTCFAMLFATGKITTIILFFSMQTNCILMGIVFCYFVELYPTRYCGMISCLGVMVARASGMSGVSLVGAYTFTHCTASVCVWGALGLSGAFIASLLPPDTPEKT